MKKHAAQESGTALIVAMLLMVVLTIMLLGFYFVTSGEQKVAASNRDNEVTYYGAVAGLEQMSSLIADYFSHTASPTPSGIVAATTTSSNFTSLDGITPTYTLYCMPPPSVTSTCPNFSSATYVVCTSANLITTAYPQGNVLGSCPGTIGGNGALAGLEGMITPFKLTVVADGPSNTEVKLTRGVEEVAVPIFEFGIFSDSDLSFFAGVNFNFGGRVHTNGNLYLAEDSGSTLNLDDHVTAAKGIIRSQLSNGYRLETWNSSSCTSANSNYCSTVNVLTTTGGCPSTLTGAQTGNCRSLGFNEGSLENGPGSTENPNWQSLSKSTYNGFIQDGTTGAKVLNLALALPGINSTPIAMIQRPPASPPAATAESPTGPLGMARFYNQASLRILLSDTQDDIMYLPGIDSTEYPYPLAEALSPGVVGVSGASSTTTMAISRSTAIPATYCPKGGPCVLPPVDACHPPLAESPAENATNDSMLPQNTTLLGGWIKIEMQCAPTAGCPGTWKDVTEEILAQGISRDEAPGVTMPAAMAYGANVNGGSLNSNTTYYYVVTAVNAFGESAGTVVSAQPGGGYHYTNNAIQLTWPAVTGATGYNVYRTTTSGTYSGTGNGVIKLVVGTAQGTSWVSPYSPTATFTDSGAITPTSSSSGPPSSSCTNTAIIHLEEAAPGVSLTTNPMNVLTPSNFVPVNMYDAREGEVRDSDTQPIPSLNGIMNLVEVDVGNLQQWFAGNIATSGKYAFNGPDALNNSGFILYTSDRRMNCNDGQYDVEGNCASGYGETGEFGNEDIINPSSTTGAPNGVLDTCPSPQTTPLSPCPPEDVDGDGVFRTYGAYAHPIATPQSVSPSGVTVGGVTSTAKWPAIISALANSATENPVEVRVTANQAQINSVVLFRRALRLVNGTAGNLPPLAAAQATTCTGGTSGGFTVTSENPIYVAGDYNASVANGFNDVSGKCHVPAAVMGDAVTLLSNNWWLGAQPDPSSPYSGDANSFANPTNPNCTNQRCATTTYYRMADMSGKTNSFNFYSNGTTPLFTGLHEDFGTDGGVHNFLRYDEDWSNATLNYLGSMASFYMSRQGTGVYKCCNTVYSPPTRNYTFDTDFQNINSLPPGTPRFTDVNALSYFQEILPNQ